MTEAKRPFHQILSEMLITAPVGITAELRCPKAAEVMTILRALHKGEMRAEYAHKIAEDYDYLPVLLRNTGQLSVAEFAEYVFEDLKGREDEDRPIPLPSDFHEHPSHHF